MNELKNNPSRQRWIRALVWTLIGALSNPYFLLPLTMYASPAAARDTEIYMSAVYSGTTAEAAVMLVLDTSDSMNLPEAWHEYPGAYDSHVEYLWNDRAILCGNGTSATSADECTEVTAENASKVSTADYPSSPTSIYGTWQGTTLEERQALWTAAKNSAFATRPGDPGPKHTWRNYNDLSWIYWLPSDADEDDPRLMSPAWNRFRGYVQQIGGNTSDHIGGTGSTAQRGGLAFNDLNDYRGYNTCNASLADFIPSTVLAPSDYARNAGKSLNQQLERWDPYRVVGSIGNAGYPGGSDQQTTGYARGYLDESAIPTGSPSNNPVYRDNLGSSPTGSNGLPIRYNDGASGAGWSNIRADLGGYVFYNEVDSYTSSTKSILDQIASYYSLNAPSDVDASGAVDVMDSKFIAWKGNRDVGVSFDIKTGVHAYYDESAGSGAASGACNATTGPASATCIAQTSGATPAFTLTATAACNTSSAGTNESDAAGNSRNRGQTCTLGAISYTSDQNGAIYPNNADVSALLSCGATTSNQSIVTTRNTGCTRTNPVVVNPCNLTQTTATINACALSGGSSVTVNSCALSGQSTVSVASCAWSGQTTYTEGTCAWSGRQTAKVEGLGWYAYGGTCQQSSGSTTGCTTSGLTTISGHNDAKGYYADSATAAASGGCGNSIPAGTEYKYGGTCAENSSTASCSVTGGTVVNINGTNRTVNQTCSNSLAAGTYNVGGTCKENSSTASCNTIESANPTVTIRGTLYSGVGRTCSNSVAAGTYRYGRTCGGTNNSCTAGSTTATSIRGTNYNMNSGPGITTTSCTGSLTAGTYYRNASCSSSSSGGIANTCTTNAASGSTVSIGGNTYYANSGSCSAGTTSGTYYTGTCTGTITSLSNTVGGGTSTLNNQAGACNVSTTPCTLGGTNYTCITSCTNKADTTTNCSSRYGSACTTGCGGNSPQSINGAAGSGTTVYYHVFNQKAKSDYLYHACKADETTGVYMRSAGASPLRPLGQPYNTTVSDGSSTAAYTNNAANKIALDSDRNVTMYSVNYLNWKFGPKGPTGAPIGRKTRLQIAKDALSNLVQNQDGVRFGLVVFNKTDNTGTNQGGNIAFPITRMGTNSGDPDYANRTALIAKINATVASSRTPLTETLYETYLYFTGGAPRYGTLATTAYTGGQVSAGRDTSTNTISGGHYISPMGRNPNSSNPAPCQKNYIVLITDGGPEDDTDADSLIQGLSQAPQTYMPNGAFASQSTLTHHFEVSNGVPYGPTDLAATSNYVWMDELAFYMANADLSSSLSGRQSVSTYTIGFAGANSPVLQNTAIRGNGFYYQADNSAALAGALSSAISTILNWTPTGAAPTVPISAYNRTENANEVYLSFFGPSINQSWPGTLKKYVVSNDATACGTDYFGKQLTQCLVGKPDSNGAVHNINQYLASGQSGVPPTVKVSDTAVSYWSDPADPDGSYPNKGGTGYVLKNGTTSNPNPYPKDRKVYTHIAGETETNLTLPVNAVSDVNASISKTLLGDASMSATTRQSLINFARGGDPIACAGASSTCTQWRTWPHHDILHSRPSIITYATSPSLRQILYYMSNDGQLHAIDTSTGAELWALMTEEAFPKMSELVANNVGEHTIGGDGSPVLYVNHIMNNDGTTNSSGKAYLMFGERRGGRAYYALDVSDPDVPRFMWKIDNTTSGFSELGETWSTPDIVNMRISTDPVAIIAGGYDPKPYDMLTIGVNRVGSTATAVSSVPHGYNVGDQVTISGAIVPASDPVSYATPYNGTFTVTSVPDDHTFTYTVAGTPPSPAQGLVKSIYTGAAAMGRGVYFVNVRTGALLKSFTGAADSTTNISVSGMNYSIPSDAIGLNTDLDAAGYVDRIYLGDMGGNIWRFSEDVLSTDQWQVTKLADLTNGSSPARRIFFPPAVVRTNINGEQYDAVYIGTGDRENPLRTDIQDGMFMIKDRFQSLTTTQDSPIAYSSSNFLDVTSSTLTSGLTPDASGNLDALAYNNAYTTALASKDGWVLPLDIGASSPTAHDSGEKVVTAPTVYFNILRFGTYGPKSQSSPCMPPGEGHLYALNASTGGYLDVNANKQISLSEQSRVSNEYMMTGMPSSGTIGIFGGMIGLLTNMGSGPVQFDTIGRAGFGTYTYWFQEPEQ